MKKILPLTLLMALALTSAALAYVGNANSYIFHTDTCRHAARIKEYNKVYFDTREQAVEAGYTPCKVCHP